MGSFSAGKRFALPMYTVLVHQPKGTLRPQQQTSCCTPRNVKSEKRLNEIYRKHTGQLLQKSNKNREKGDYDSEHRKEFGLVDDKVIDKRPGDPPLAVVS